jgi:hypothetical protein
MNWRSLGHNHRLVWLAASGPKNVVRHTLTGAIPGTHLAGGGKFGVRSSGKSGRIFAKSTPTRFWVGRW